MRGRERSKFLGRNGKGETVVSVAAAAADAGCASVTMEKIL